MGRFEALPYAWSKILVSPLLPKLASIFAGSEKFTAVDTFDAFHRHAALKRHCEEEMASVDVLGLVRVADPDGRAIEVEIWSMTRAAFGAFVAAIPSPLGIGRIELEDGSDVSGFLCEAWTTGGAEEITSLGGWRAYADMRAKATNSEGLQAI